MAFSVFTSSGNQYVDATIIFLCSILAVLCGTMIFTELRYRIQSKGNACRFQGREPLTLPYAVLWLGGFYRMVNPHGMYEYAL